MSGEREKKQPFFERLMRFLNVLVILALLGSYAGGSISPERFWPLAFFAMAYPLILISLFIFSIYWLLKRRWFLFINIVFLLIKWDYVEATVQFPKGDGQKLESGINVMSFNVRLFDRFNWIEGNDTEKSIYKFIFDQKPDILCIQEFHVENKKRSTPLDTLLNLPSLNYFHIEKNPKKTKWKAINGMATFSRFPIIEQGIVFYRPEHNNMAIFTDVLADNDTIRVYNVHLQSIGLQDKDYAVIDELMENQQMNDSRDGRNLVRYMRDGFKKRSEQAELIAEHIRTCRYPIILCGDFNDVPTSYAYQIIQKGLKDSFAESGSGFGATYVRVPFFRIDNLLHSPDFTATNHEVHQEVLSDHLAVTCQIKKN